MMQVSPTLGALRGALIRSFSDQSAVFLPDGLVLFTIAGPQRGRIVAIGDAASVAAAQGLSLASIPKSEGLWLPAFFDTHFHWVQDAVREMAKYSLIEWLHTITFPEEAKFADAAFAEEQAERFWSHILSLGTVGGLCYSSVHEVALDAAMRHAPEDFYIGNVLMTMECPDYLKQTESEAIELVKQMAARYGKRTVCSPRFAPTTAPAVMRAAAEVAVSYGTFQQTHLGETEAEIEWVLGLYRNLTGFADVASYTAIYERVGMLGPTTVFGHCLYLDDHEWALLAASGSRIASCPTSNAPVGEMGLGSGLFDYPEAEARGILWSLASDIGGGPYLSMFDVMQSFVRQHRAAGRGDATYTKALHRATRKGAELMNLDNRGALSEGFSFDAIRVPMPDGAFSEGAAEPLLAALMGQLESRRASESLVLETWINGESRFVRESGSCV